MMSLACVEALELPMAHGASARCAAWWARAMPPGVRPVEGVLGVRLDGGWSTAAPRGSAGRFV